MMLSDPPKVDHCLEQLEIVGNLSREAILVYDRNERIRYANRASQVVLGARDPEELVGRAMEDFVPPEEREHLEVRRRAIAAGVPVEAEEFEVMGLDGQRRTVFVASQPIRYEGMGARLIVARDVTAQRESENMRNDLERQLAASRRLEGLGRLAGGVAHDFNNLLTVIAGYSELALSEIPEDDPVRLSLDQIAQATDRAAVLTRQLLAFGRKQVLRLSVLDLNDVVRDVQPMLSRLIGEDVELVLELSREACPVTADRGQVEQVLVNLVMNARDAMPEGGRVTISTRVTREVPPFANPDFPTSQGCHSILSVSDEGVGMDAETADRIFEPFFSTKTQGGGTGLGLATVYGIVKQSGGAIEVDTRPGGGTTFRVWLPKAWETDPLEESDGPGSGPGEEARPAARVAIVEDDAGIRQLAVRVLEREGYRVHAFADAESALDALLGWEEAPDLLVTDVVLPGMDGGQLAARAGRAHPGLRILFISGYTDDRLGRKGIVSQEVELLEKPFTPRALLARVAEMLAED